MEKLAVPSMEEQNDNKVIINLRSSFIHIIPTRNSDSDVTISSKNNVFFSGTDSRLEMVFMQFFSAVLVTFIPAFTTNEIILILLKCIS